MRTSSRFPLPAILGAFVLSSMPVLAGSTSTTLTVGVTVVRSCAVRASSVGQGAARLDLTCAAGAAANVRRGVEGGSDDAVKTLRLQVPTSAYRGIVDGNVEVATVNF